MNWWEPEAAAVVCAWQREQAELESAILRDNTNQRDGFGEVLWLDANCYWLRKGNAP